MKKLLLALAFIVLFVTPSHAIELLMFSNPNCNFCVRFLEEVKPTYAESEAGKVLPLHIIDMDGPVPDWYIEAFISKRVGRIAGTPTFMIWTDREITRWVGYNGKDDFYKNINQFIANNKHLIEAEENAPPFLGKQNEDQWAPQKDPRDDPNSSHNKPFKRHDEGSHSQHLELKRAVPDGVKDSDNIFDHTYDTPQKALAAADYLDCGSNVHYHAKENVWMPCSMAISPGTDTLMKEGR